MARSEWIGTKQSTGPILMKIGTVLTTYMGSDGNAIELVPFSSIGLIGPVGLDCSRSIQDYFQKYLFYTLGLLGFLEFGERIFYLGLLLYFFQVRDVGVEAEGCVCREGLKTGRCFGLFLLLFTTIFISKAPQNRESKFLFV